VVDTYGSYAFGFLHTSKVPEAAVSTLHNDALPFYAERQIPIPITALLTDNGREFCGTSAHPYEVSLALNGIDHNSSSGQNPWDRIHATGYQYSAAAENIAAGYTTSESVIDAFFNETPPNDGHRRNLINCSLQDVGYGYAYQAGSPYGSYWTQDFATPL
jgi:hypothetical protein